MKCSFVRKIMFFVLPFFFYVTPIYALSFDVETTLTPKSINAGDKVTMDLNIKNIRETNTGISSCEMNISLSDGIEFGSNYELLDDSWKYEKGKEKVSFYSINSYSNDFKLFSVSFKANKAGKITISNFECYGVDSDTENEENYNYGEVVVDIKLNVSSSSESFSSSSSSSSSSSTRPSSSSSLSSSSLSKPSSSSSSKKSLVNGFEIIGGTVDFNSDVKEYRVYVDSLEDVGANVIVDEGIKVQKTDFLLDDYGVEFYFLVSDNNGNEDEYSIQFIVSDLLKEEDDLVSDIEISNGTTSKKKFTWIFIVIIVILLGINVYRIISNKKKILD